MTSSKNKETNSENSMFVENTAYNTKQVYLISENNFNRIRKFQQDIFERLEMTPSIRKVINQLITDENLEKIKAKFFYDITDND